MPTTEPAESIKFCGQNIIAKFLFKHIIWIAELPTICLEPRSYSIVTITNAIQGMKNVILHRQEFIKGLDDLTKDWDNDSAKGMVEAVKDFMTKDIGAFEWILRELVHGKNAKKVTSIKKKKLTP